MRGTFFLYLFLSLFVILAVWFLWMVLKAFYTVYEDARDYRELSRLGDELAEKRRRAKQLAEARLKNGCEHEFDDALGALPPDVCCKCGIHREPPPGKCDHRWRKLPGIIPQSRCEKCNAHFSRVPVG